MTNRDTERAVNIAEMYSAVQIERMITLIGRLGAKRYHPTIVLLAYAYQRTRNLGI